MVERMIGWITFLAWAAVAALQAQVVINEIQIRPDRTREESARNHQWVELWNRSSDPVDVAGWRLANQAGRAGESSRGLPPVVIPPGGYLVIHISQGENQPEFGETGAQHFTQDPADTTLWDRDSGAIALYSPDAIVDFFAWATLSKPLDAGEAGRAAIAANIWGEGRFLNLDRIQRSAQELVRVARPGESLGRDPAGTDTNTPIDFDVTGGVGSDAATPGTRNYAPILIDQAPVPFTEADEFASGSGHLAKNARKRAEGDPPVRKWTVMFYLACDDDSIQEHCLEYLARIHRAGGSNDKVAFTALYDGFDNLKTADLSGNVTLRGMVAPATAVLPAYPTGNRLVSEKKGYLLSPSGDTSGVVLEERNTGNPSTLGGFIGWSRAYVPAERYMLILVGHGRGWKAFGPDLSSPGSLEPFDALYMNELREAMHGAPLDLLVFNSCLMGELEVAHQFIGKARYFIGSEENMGSPGFDLERLHAALNFDPTPEPQAIGESMVDNYVANQQRNGNFIRSTISLVDMERVASLSAAVNTWALTMRRGMPYFVNRDNPGDNVQTSIYGATEKTTVFSDSNFIDLGSFAREIRQHALLPECAKNGVNTVLERLGSAVLKRSYSEDMADTAGLSIYFPGFRMKDLGVPLDEDATPYDFPLISRSVDGDSRMVVYARNRDELPLKAHSMEMPEIPLNPRTEWPAPPAPGLLFVDEYPEWSRFVDRFYHPVADATILYGLTPSGERIEPETIPGGACQNSTDRISLRVNSKILLSGHGSTDWDMRTSNGKPYHHIWDTNSEEECTVNCIPPSGVPAGSDAAFEATDNLDQDRFPNDTLLDDRDTVGDKIQAECGPTPRQFFVTLHVWDDNHTFPFHNTVPTAEYVHPQTARHTAEINCTLAPGTFISSGGQFYIQPDDIVRIDNSIGVGRAQFTIVSTTGVRNLVIERSDAYTSTARTPPASTGNQASAQSPPESAPVPVPDGTSVTTTASGRGTFTLDFIAGEVGPGRIVLDIPGIGQRTISFTIQRRLAPEPDELIISPPGIATVGINANLVVEVRRGGRPLQDAVVTFLAADNNAVFTNGTTILSGRGTQVRTTASGRTFAAVQAQVNGEIPIIILSGGIRREVNIIGSGSANTSVTRVTTLELPESLTVGQQSRVVFGVFSGNARMPNQPVRISVVRGDILVAGSSAGTRSFDVRTNAQGEAVFPFTVNGLAMLELTAAVTGTQIGTRVVTWVRPAGE
jgi:hypothetical protein